MKIKRKHIVSLTLIVVFITAIINCNKSIKKSEPAPASEYRNVTNSGAWCWFSDPRAVYYEGEYKRTYAGWVNNNGDIQIGFYDHNRDTIQIHTVHKNLEKDDHNNPSLYIDNNGKITVFYSRHGGNKGIFRMVSKDKESIDQWEERDTLKLNSGRIDKYDNSYLKSYTYTNPVYLDDEDRLYLFWRGAGVKPNMAWSDDNGESWEGNRIFIKPTEHWGQRPYLKVASEGKDKIHFAFTDGHPRKLPENSIYYARYQNDSFYKADGSKITDMSNTPFKPKAADTVYNADTTGEKAWVWDVAIDKEKKPVIVYARFPDDSNHVYYYARWNGKEWQNNKIVNSGKWFPQTPSGEEEDEPNYSGGIVLDHENPNIVYLSINKNNTFEIEKWITKDYGKSWNIEKVTKDSQNDNVRPVAVRNIPQNSRLQFMWMNNKSYIRYRDFNSNIKLNLPVNE